MAEIDQNRYDQLLRRVTNAVGTGSHVAESLSELFPTIDVENVPAELLLLGGTRICMGGGTIGPTVAEASRAQLFNPADSGILATITSCWVAAPVTDIIRWGVVATVFGTAIGTETFTDTRLGLTQQPVVDVREGTAAAFADATNQTILLASTAFHLHDQNAIAVLAPGTGFEIGLGTDNVRMNYAFQWRERVAEAAELQF